MQIYVHIKPNSSPSGVLSQESIPQEKFGIFGKHSSGSNSGNIIALKVAVGAAPVDGSANEELMRVLAEYYNVPKSRISIVRGDKSRYKVIEVS